MKFKNKKLESDFFEWLSELDPMFKSQKVGNESLYETRDMFEILPLSAQFGLFTEFCIKEKEIFTYIYPSTSGWVWGFEKTNGTNIYGWQEQLRDSKEDCFDTPEEAIKAVVEIVNETY